MPYNGLFSGNHIMSFASESNYLLMYNDNIYSRLKIQIRRNE